MSHLGASAVRTPHEVLTCYYQAMLDKSPDDLADLYATDAVHEFPFTSPGFPSRFEGREAVRAGYRAAWGAGPAQVQEVRRIAAYETADPEVIIAEHVVVGTLPAKAATFTVPGLLILQVRKGLIARVRDYMDGSGVAAARA
ncbi:nuclear transport factor 2 family protein [Streptomyces canus]|uniref:Ketosteroid isomerase-like protein n=1 Tax=Streptomyces canus TaxID=58343 RepID=A0AAW8FRT9_9ACTN|nr:nuclear transport factor 2 family protein [Streptomyces canus]MDQ0759097.1 ketosteroid isomerase-like protein [Streptomyces canus]MDQ0912288.1 ketosteroid isomerase-like protein [Streptomyces canus]